MQLFLCARKCWKCVDVNLKDGSVPCIGTVSSPDQQIEPAQWFKVLVLESVCVDCSERAVSWNIGQSKKLEELYDQESASFGNLPSDKGLHVSLPSGSEDYGSPNPLFSCGGNHSLMAPHDEGNSTLCTSDLQALFELAEILFDQENDHRMWLRFLHCYLLPVITFQYEDLAAVSLAHSDHVQALHIIDEQLEDIASRSLKLKKELAAVFSMLLPHVGKWVPQGCCSSTFISFISSDVELHEREARTKIQSFARNIEFNQRLGTSISQSFWERILKEKVEAEQVLVEMVELHSILEGAMGLPDEDQEQQQVEGWEMQKNYVHLHIDLNQLRKRATVLSTEKVLALSVREAFEQTISCLESGRATSGVDVGIQGGHSTDVLREAAPVALHDCNIYLTWRDKIQKLLHLQSTPLAQLHDLFSHHLHDMLVFSSAASGEEQKVRWKTGSTEHPPDSKSLALLVHQHCEKIVNGLCAHFDDHNTIFFRRAWLCYERLVFESFSQKIFFVYQTEQSKNYHQLIVNAIGLSIVDPWHLDLGAVDESWLRLFPPRPFSFASLLYKQATESSNLLSDADPFRMDSTQFPYLEYFSGFTSDLLSLPLAISPLDKLQILTSAFRKTMAGLSKLKLKLYQSDNNVNVGALDASLGAVNCDNILPVIVLLLLQLPPRLLGILYLNCCLLTDFMAPFLSAGWHGYSLTTFSSTLKIISKL